MARHIGGSPARSGYYWNPKNWSITPIPRQGGFLPGGPSDRYLQDGQEQEQALEALRKEIAHRRDGDEG